MSDVPREITLQSEPPTAPDRRNRGRRFVLLLGVLAVLAGGVFAAFSLADDEENTPEEAVRGMIAALEQGDVLGMLEQLDPAERDVLRDPLVELVDELNRLEILDADLEDLSGIALEFRDLELAVSEVRDDLAAVRITGGRSTYGIDASELPIGNFVRDLIGDGLEGADSSGEEEIGSTDPDELIATIRRDGRWYVSIGYSVAESARRDAGVSIEDLPEGVTPAGADSPEEAVQEMIEAAAGFDLRRVLELLAPDEMGALQDYAGLFLPEAERAADDARAEAEVEIQALELESDRSGQRARVFVRELAARAEADGQVLAIADGCVRVTANGREQQRFCQGGDPAEMLQDNPILGSMFGSVEPPKLSFADADPPFGIATVEIDGKWYVSPVRSTLDVLVETARLFQPEDLREVRRFLEELFAAFTGGFGMPMEAAPGLDGTATQCMEQAASALEFQECLEQLGQER